MSQPQNSCDCRIFVLYAVIFIELWQVFLKNNTFYDFIKKILYFHFWYSIVFYVFYDQSNVFDVRTYFVLDINLVIIAT